MECFGWERIQNWLSSLAWANIEVLREFHLSLGGPFIRHDPKDDRSLGGFRHAIDRLVHTCTMFDGRPLGPKYRRFFCFEVQDLEKEGLVEWLRWDKAMEHLRS